MYVINRQTSIKISLKQVKHLVKTFLDWKQVQSQELSIHFVDKKRIGALHQQYFQDPSPTDCISFPIDMPGANVPGIKHPQKKPQKNQGHINETHYSVLGDIFVCPEVAIEYAQKHGGDPYWEVSLYIIHGLLHLLGYDDQDPKNRSLMFAEQQSSMLYLEKNHSLLHN